MKNKNLLNLSKSLPCKLLLTLALIIGWGSSAWADELTVDKGSSGRNNTYTAHNPINGTLLNSTLIKSELIYPSTKVEGLAGKNITGMTFHLNAATTTWGDAEFSVFIKETDTEVYTGNASSNFLGNDGATVVYTGSLDPTSASMSIDFSTPFYYSGSKNLLVGIYGTKTGTASENMQFVLFTDDPSGTYNYRSLFSSSASGFSRSNFLPKVTFVYETPVTNTLSISPDEDVAFGTVWANDSKDYTITNNSGSSVDVTPSVSGTGASSFSVSPSTVTSIASGSSQTFTVSFNYDSSNLGEKKATITFTPSDGDDAVAISATATSISDNSPVLSVSPNEAIAFGNVTANASKNYTVSNSGTGSLSVNISSDNTDYFTVSPSSISNLANGESQEFTVTYAYTLAADKLGEHTATITVTPTSGEESAVEISASATSVTGGVFDEDSTPSYTSGNKSLLVKYTPVSGWNTFCMPVSLSSSSSYSSFMTPLFGSDAKAYSLTSYENNVLTFTKQTTISAAKPYLVYVESAASHPDGVVYESIYIYSTAAGSTNPAGTTAYFQGTYSTKTFTSGDNWYGVTPAGKVMKAGEGANIKGYRAYFTGVSAPANGARISIVIEGEEDTTDLGFVKMIDDEAKDVYTLSGQKVEKAGKGIYIVNGRKVVIK